MSGNTSRRKGRAGETTFKLMLADRDFIVADLSCGIASEDLLAVKEGVTWACEVKTTKTITETHMKQAREQAAKRKARWMLANKLHGTSSWLVRRQGEKPVVWHEK